MTTATYYLSKKVADAVFSMTDGMQPEDKKIVLGTAICQILDRFEPSERKDFVSEILVASKSEKETKKKLIGRDEVLNRLGIKYTSLYNMMNRGDFPRALKIGGKNMWTIDDVEKYLERAERRRQ